mgnify:CR=1 FL=1
MRGDRPLEASELLPMPSATPHARGSTLIRLAVLADPEGYPACAGIDPRAVRSIGVPQWLPRMRGDRPQSRAEHWRPPVATPHARGSTLAPGDHGRTSCGYPACAGIDPVPQSSGIRGHGLPRMRGDRPGAAE